MTAREENVVLVLGSGAREHSMVWKLAQSDQVSKVLIAPGNGGTMQEKKVENAKGLSSMKGCDVVPFCLENKVSLVAVGPEVPLVDGIADDLRKAGIPCFGPSKSAARLEGSKAFSKEFMVRNGVPTATHKSFTDYEKAVAYTKEVFPSHKVVVKASGLAAGKGVILPETCEEAIDALKMIMVDEKFGKEAGKEVVIEEFLEGPEVSVFALCDGENVVLLPAAQDHKRIFDGDKGPNTGGMGAYCPAPVLTPELQAEAKEQIVLPTIRGCKKEGFPFVGVLFCGLMITKQGIKTLEYNVRPGCPELTCVLPLVENDLFEIMSACVEGKLDRVDIKLKKDTFAVTIVAASEGYPGSYEKGKLISGIDKAEELDPRIKVFNAGTAQKPEGLVTSGGRVLTVTAYSDESLQAAVKLAYKGMKCVKFEGMQYRTDIAHRALKKRTTERTELQRTIVTAGIAAFVALALFKILKKST